MHSEGLELTQMTYSRHEDNLLHHRGDRVGKRMHGHSYHQRKEVEGHVAMFFIIVAFSTHAGCCLDCCLWSALFHLCFVLFCCVLSLTNFRFVFCTFPPYARIDLTFSFLSSSRPDHFPFPFLSFVFTTLLLLVWPAVGLCSLRAQYVGMALFPASLTSLRFDLRCITCLVL